MKFFCHTITFLIASPSNDRYLARKMKTHAYWRSASGRLCGKTRKNLQNTRHTATCIDWSRGVSSLLHEDQMTAYYSPLTPRYVGKEYGNTTWNRSRAAWIIIHFVLQATSTCCVGGRAPAGRARGCAWVHASAATTPGWWTPGFYLTRIGLHDRHLISRAPGTVGYPLFTPFTTPRLPSRPLCIPTVCLSGHWSGIARDNVTRRIIIAAISSKFQDVRDLYVGILWVLIYPSYTLLLYFIIHAIA